MLEQMSPSSRRAWIEIRRHTNANEVPAVALLAEGVDRNSKILSRYTVCHVALLAEGVDRNTYNYTVDDADGESPSSRRAWIEIA